MSEPATRQAHRFVVASVAVLREGHLLTVRKRGQTHWQLPGGKIDAGESTAQAAAREVLEETGLRLDVDTLSVLGEFQDVAASDPTATVHATVFITDASGDPVASAEIEQVRWLDIADTSDVELAPLLRGHILPAVRATATRRSAR